MGVKDVVEVLGRALADRPDEVHVVETEHKGTTLVELYVAAGDAGKMIGRQGRTVAALRTLMARHLTPVAAPAVVAPKA